jgi:hypothetical protein
MDQTTDAPITRSSQRLLAITNGLSLRSGRALESRDDDNPRMRIGVDFQAILPDLKESSQDEGREGRPKPLLLWKPNESVADEDVDGFLEVARDHYNFSHEQALGLLFWFNYDISNALAELKNYSPFEDEWTIEDKVIFEQAFQKYGKNFQRIRSMLPSKPIGCLVKFYYQWKKEHLQLSMIDKKAHMRKLWCGHVATNGEHNAEKEDMKRRKLPKVCLGLKLLLVQ